MKKLPSARCSMTPVAKSKNVSRKVTSACSTSGRTTANTITSAPNPIACPIRFSAGRSLGLGSSTGHRLALLDLFPPAPRAEKASTIGAKGNISMIALSITRIAQIVLLVKSCVTVYTWVMDSLVQADIFFFITSIAVVIGALLVSIFLIYGILIVRDIRAVSQRVKRETELISMDIDAAREKIKQEGREFSSILGFLKGIWDIRKKKNSKK